MRVRTLALATAAVAAAVGCRAKPLEHAKTNLTSATVNTLASRPGEKLALANKPFEGEIQLELHRGADGAKTITYDIKGSELRYAESGSSATASHVVADLAEQKAYALFDPTKSYVELDESSPEKTQNVSIWKSGKMEKVAGHDCEDWTLKTGSRSVEVCAAHDIPYFDLAAKPTKAKLEPLWAAKLDEDHAFPLRVVEKDSSGKIALTAEAKSLQEKPLDESLFRVPGDYHRSQLATNRSMPGI